MTITENSLSLKGEGALGWYIGGGKRIKVMNCHEFQCCPAVLCVSIADYLQRTMDEMLRQEGVLISLKQQHSLEMTLFSGITISGCK